MTKEVLLHGDALERLKELPDNSVDSVVTDPPYGLSKEPDIVEVLTKWINGEPYNHKHGGFMGKEWDSFVPHPDLWKEVYRVLKPGGHALVFAGTRTQDLMTIALRLAGFEVRDVLQWIYFNGFPKNTDISKEMDRFNGSPVKIIEATDNFGNYLKKKRNEKGFTNKDMDNFLGTNTMYSWYEGRPKGRRIPPKDKYEILKEVLELSDEFDWLIEREGAVREGVKTVKRNISHVGRPSEGEKTTQGNFIITKPKTHQAKKWEGWGTALKPSHEPIILVRKPMLKRKREMLTAECVERYGTGGVFLDYKPHENSDEKYPHNSITLEEGQFFSEYFNIVPEDLAKKSSKKDRNSDWKGEQIKVGDRNNIHPTVKPTDLMAWLVRLVTPPNGTVLDPFAGSGSTLVAAKREGFGFIGVELTDEYIPIIEARTGVKADEK